MCRRWDATWSLENGSINARLAAQQRSGPGWREYLTRLHTTGEYPYKGNWDRFVWAVVVDAVFALMLGRKGAPGRSESVPRVPLLLQRDLVTVHTLANSVDIQNGEILMTRSKLETQRTAGSRSLSSG